MTQLLNNTWACPSSFILPLNINEKERSSTRYRIFGNLIKNGHKCPRKDWCFPRMTNVWRPATKSSSLKTNYSSVYFIHHPTLLPTLSF